MNKQIRQHKDWGPMVWAFYSKTLKNQRNNICACTFTQNIILKFQLWNCSGFHVVWNDSAAPCLSFHSAQVNGTTTTCRTTLDASGCWLGKFFKEDTSTPTDLKCLGHPLGTSWTQSFLWVLGFGNFLYFSVYATSITALPCVWNFHMGYLKS